MINQPDSLSQENINQPSMKESSFKDLLSQVQFVVPEIQREYVWGANKDIIYNFLNSIKDENALNIGFLYSYTPNYATSEQKISYLIDGQQRFTTLYLLAFYRAIKDNRCGEFKKIASNFSYRVRHSTAQFLEQLVDNTEYLSELENIEDKTWFLSYYKQDISISNILEIIKLLNGYAQNNLPSYEQIIAVKFYNFNIAATGQGEELYISMNSRGEKIQDNENLRAKLFEKLSDTSKRNEWAKKYDNWQEFFWRNRGGNSSADEGFNKFIAWINKIEGKKNQNELNFATLEKYFIGLERFTVLLRQHKKQIHTDAKIPLDGAEGNLFVLVMLYLVSYRIDIIGIEFRRFARFFANISYNKGSNPIDDGIKLAKIIVDKNILDTIDLLDSNIENKLLDGEEKEKLEIFRNSEIEREKLEDLFAKLEDSKILKGCIKPFIDNSKKQNEAFNTDKFNKYYKIFIVLFGSGNASDLVRRALLTFHKESDYSYRVGWSNSFTGHRFTLCYKAEEWSNSWKKKGCEAYFLLFNSIISSNNYSNIDDVLQKIVFEFTRKESYYYNIIKNEKALYSSPNKYFVWDERNTIVTHILHATKGNNATEYSKFNID